MSRHHGALLCCVLVLLAGCSGFVADDGSTAREETLGNATVPGTDAATQTTTATRTTTDGEPAGSLGHGSGLPVNTTRVLDRTDRLLGQEFEPVDVLDDDIDPRNETTDHPDEFARTLGVENATRTRAGTFGRMLDANSVVILTTNRSTPASIRALVVHEYVHATNFQRESYGNVERMIFQDDPRRRAGLAIREGSATYVAQAYAERYADVAQHQANVCETYEDGEAATRIWFGRYCVGARYVDDRIDDPANLSAIYENPPNTTEQVRHGYRPQEEPPVPLLVNATGNDEWRLGTTHRQGELWTYAVLSATLSDARADRAATGWGNDRRVRFTAFDGDGYAWVTRWDTEGDADEFAAAMDAHAANATSESVTDATFAVERVDATTVVVLVGAETFVDETTINATSETTVVVRPPNATAGNATVAAPTPTTRLSAWSDDPRRDRYCDWAGIRT